MNYVVTHDGDEHEVEVREREDGMFVVVLDGEELTVDFCGVPERSICSMILNGKSYEVLLNRENGKSTVIQHGQSAEFEVESERERNARLIAADGQDSSGESVYAVMPGIVVSVAVAPGDEVEGGATVAVLEAMKMENDIKVKSSGRVAKVAVEAGQTVNAGDLLIEVEAID